MIKVVAGIVVRDGRLLLQQRTPGRDFEFTWESPGGKVEEGETPLQALVREIREEVDLVAMTIDPAPVWSSEFRAASVRSDRQHIDFTFYRVAVAVGAVIPREGQGWGWFTEAEFFALRKAKVLAPANHQAFVEVCRSAFHPELAGVPSCL